ncbi:MAG: beta-N-acetylhexosaminidase, partial [Candidatus Baltobacteraceae bacterium]
MTELEQLARGVLLVGFDGTSLEPQLAHRFAAEQFAGYVLFSRNMGPIREVRELTDALRSLHALAPVLAVDQEGGRVMRLREGVEPMPPMMAIGAAGDDALAGRAGEQVAFDLRRAGFTLDFAPVLDLAREPLSTVIGTRSFGSQVAQVVALGRAFAAGLERVGVTATFKHFPGHGTTAVDSHLSLPTIESDEKTLRENDLAPFAQVAQSARAFMTAHIIVRAFDRENPGTLSRKLLTDVLRGELNFRGVCFTDCMQMDAIVKTSGTAIGALRAIAAGADCALISHDPALAVETARAIVRGVETGELPYARLSEAYARVKRLRERAMLPLPLEAASPHRGIGREIARRAITLLRGAPRADATTCIAVSFQGSTAEGAQGLSEDHALLEAQAPALETHILPLAPSLKDRATAIAAIIASQRRP